MQYVPQSSPAVSEPGPSHPDHSGTGLPGCRPLAFHRRAPYLACSSQRSQGSTGWRRGSCLQKSCAQTWVRGRPRRRCCSLLLSGAAPPAAEMAGMPRAVGRDFSWAAGWETSLFGWRRVGISSDSSAGRCLLPAQEAWWSVSGSCRVGTRLRSASSTPCGTGRTGAAAASHQRCHLGTTAAGADAVSVCVSVLRTELGRAEGERFPIAAPGCLKQAGPGHKHRRGLRDGPRELLTTAAPRAPPGTTRSLT